MRSSIGAPQGRSTISSILLWFKAGDHRQNREILPSSSRKTDLFWSKHFFRKWTSVDNNKPWEETVLGGYSIWMIQYLEDRVFGGYSRWMEEPLEDPVVG